MCGEEGVTMPVNARALPATPDLTPSSLAEFSLAGLQCVVVPMAGTRSAGDGIVGTLTVGGQRFAVIGEKRSDVGPDLLDSLTPRELEVALLVAAGAEAKAIARRLRISFHTVRVYVGRIYAKLGLHKQTELAACIAVRFGSTRGQR
jgi:DNA-binding CsgD family transcriptional regulator